MTLLKSLRSWYRHVCTDNLYTWCGVTYHIRIVVHVLTVVGSILQTVRADVYLYKRLGTWVSLPPLAVAQRMEVTVGKGRGGVTLTLTLNLTLKDASDHRGLTLTLTLTLTLKDVSYH